MATDIATTLRTYLAIIATNKAIIENAQEQFRLGKLSRDAAKAQINAALDKIKDADNILSATLRQNPGSVFKTQLQEAIRQAESAASFGENAYKYVRGGRPDKLEEGKKDQYYAKIKQFAELYQSTQAIVNRAIQLCPTNKKQADILFNNAEFQFNDLLLRIKAVMQEVQIPEIDANLDGIRSSTAQAISDLDVARKKCQNRPQTVASTTPEPAAEELTEVQVTGTRVNTNQGLEGEKKETRTGASTQDAKNFDLINDWRVRLRLAPNATYLYKDTSNELLAPLRESDGIIFPYTPSISVSYAANYDETIPVHSNYKIMQYQNSVVDSFQITCDFTAQDTKEANYLLAVIHFFRSVTKMFYGQDQNPKPGTPPPLCYVYGLGKFQFNNHPLLIKNFAYTLPNDVDYIRAGKPTTPPGVSNQPNNKPDTTVGTPSQNRLKQILVQVGTNFVNKINPGGEVSPDNYTPGGFNSTIPPGTEEPTYVPTRISISITAVPVVSRNDVSNNFSVKEYANGNLLIANKNKNNGAFW